MCSLTSLPAGQLSLFDLFRTMDEEFRLEVCNLVEYMQCPEGMSDQIAWSSVQECYLCSCLGCDAGGV
jgi:hypothetical protein